MENAIVWLLVTLVGSFGGAWFGAYFKKKGENYATREDVGELTRVTKGIEAKISDEVWNRQRQWELKRDVLLGAVKRLGACHEAFLQLVIACTARGDTPELVENRIQRSRTFNELSTEFGGSTLLLVNLVCGRECAVAFGEFGLLLRELGTATMTGDISAFSTSKEFGPKYRAACNALRKELGVGEAGVAPS